MYLTPLTYPELFQHTITQQYPTEHFLRQRRHAFRPLESLQSGFNHCPEDVGVWIPYNGYRYKDYYRIRLVDGTVIPQTRPNADAFIVKETPESLEEAHQLSFSRGSIINEKQVTHVMLVPDEELGQFDYKGQSRFDRQREMFGELVPPVGTFDGKYS